MRQDRCIVYTTDVPYLFATFVSAMQARRHTSPSTADVAIFCINLDSVTANAFRNICEYEEIALLHVDAGTIEKQNAMLSRLFLDRFVPSQYQHLLYLDSDVHILGDLDPLLEADVPPGYFLAANDPMTFLLADNSPLSKNLGRHLTSLGLNEQQRLNYFNSGVLRIARKGWENIGADAWRHYQRCGRSRFPDQDALNIAAGDRRLVMSLAWNFPVFMRYSRTRHSIHPRIEHFMSSPKPWHGNFPPWTSKEYRPYQEALKQYPELTLFSHNMPLASRAVYHVQQRYKRTLEQITWGFGKRRRRILDYEAECQLSYSRFSSSLEQFSVEQSLVR